MAFPGEHLGEQSDSATCVSFQPPTAGGISSASTSKIPPHPHQRNSPTESNGKSLHSTVNAAKLPGLPPIRRSTTIPQIP